MGFVMHKVYYQRSPKSLVAGWSYRGDGTKPWGIDDPSIGVEQVMPNLTLLVAPTGLRYESMRDLFTAFRLGACSCGRQTDQLAQLRHSLRAIDLEWQRIDQEFLIDDVFGGVRGYMEDYIHWIEREGFASCSGDGQLADLRLSKEGRAVLHLLDLTQAGSNIDASPTAILKMRKGEAFL